MPPPEAEPDQRLRAGAAVGERPGDPGRAIAYLAHGQRLVAVGHAGCRGQQQAPDVADVAVARRLAVAAEDQRVAFGGREHRQLGHRGARSVRRVREQRHGAAEEPAGPPRAEQIRAVFQRERRAAVPRDVRAHAEVEPGETGGHRPGGRGDAREAERRRRARPVAELDLHERRVRERAVRRELVEERLERGVLVPQRVGRDVPDPAEQFGEGRIARQRYPQRDGAGEPADHLLELGARAAAHRGADHHVALPRVAGQHRHQAGEEQDEHGGVGAAGHHRQPPGCRGVDGGGRHRAVRGPPGGPRRVGRQREDAGRAA